MPPVRTKKSTPSKLGGPLAAFGFVKIDKEEALARAAKVVPTNPDPLATSSSPTSEDEDVDDPALRTKPRGGSFQRPPKGFTQKGEKRILFHGDSGGSSYIFQCDLEAQTGSAARELHFGTGYQFTSRHIDVLVNKFTHLCKNLWAIELAFMDRYKQAFTEVLDVDDNDLIRLAKACPSLRSFKLPCAEMAGGDATFKAFCQHCPALNRLEIFAGIGCLSATGSWFDELRENLAWAPKLKKLTISEQDVDTPWSEEDKYKNAMLAMSKERKDLLIMFVRCDDMGSYGGRSDFEVFMDQKYKGGKKVKCQEFHREKM